jgi:hypothetical protein
VKAGGMQGSIAQKIALFITTAVRTSDHTKKFGVLREPNASIKSVNPIYVLWGPPGPSGITFLAYFPYVEQIKHSPIFLIF